MSGISEKDIHSLCLNQQHIFRDYSNNTDTRITAIEFSADGKKLMATSNKAMIEVYDCDTLRQSIVYVKKYGCHKFSFVDEGKILVASTFPRQNRYISLLDVGKREYISFYSGHNALVKSVSILPKQNIFLTSSADDRVLLWDVRESRPKAELILTDHFKYSAQPIDNSTLGPTIDFHPSGQLFAVGVDSQFVGLYDLRGTSYGPFTQPFKFKPDNQKWTSMRFSNDGNQMVVSTNGPKIRVFETRGGKVQNVFNSKCTTHKKQKHSI